MRFPVLSMAAAAVLVPALASAQTVVTDPQLQATTQQILTVEQQQLAVAKQQLVVLDTIEALLQAQATRTTATEALAYGNSIAQAQEAERTQQAAK